MEIDSRRIGCQKVTEVAWLRGGGVILTTVWKGVLQWLHYRDEAYYFHNLYSYWRAKEIQIKN